MLGQYEWVSAVDTAGDQPGEHAHRLRGAYHALQEAGTPTDEDAESGCDAGSRAEAQEGGGFLKNPGSSFCVLPKHKAAACITIAGTELTQLCGEWLGHGHAHVGRRWPMSDRVVRPQAHRV